MDEYTCRSLPLPIGFDILHTQGLPKHLLTSIYVFSPTPLWLKDASSFRLFRPWYVCLLMSPLLYYNSMPCASPISFPSRWCYIHQKIPYQSYCAACPPFWSPPLAPFPFLFLFYWWSQSPTCPSCPCPPTFLVIPTVVFLSCHPPAFFRYCMYLFKKYSWRMLSTIGTIVCCGILIWSITTTHNIL